MELMVVTAHQCARVGPTGRIPMRVRWAHDARKMRAVLARGGLARVRRYAWEVKVRSAGGTGERRTWGSPTTKRRKWPFRGDTLTA